MICHGELVQRKPPPERLTSFYLAVSAGGALGGMLVALVSPLVFSSYLELNLSLLVGFGLALYVFADEARVHWFPQVSRAVAERGSDAGRGGVRHRRLGAMGSLGPRRRLAARAEFLRRDVGQGTLPGKARVARLGAVPRTHLARLRAHLAGDARPADDLLYGRQRRGPRVGRRPRCKRRCAWAWSDWASAPWLPTGRRATIFASTKSTTDVIRLARDYFSFLPQCAATVEVVAGDARLSLEREPSQQFDVLVLDAFSGDAIPVHLLTAEAFAIYLRHLRADGVIAVHISSRYVDLVPVVTAMAQHLELDEAFLAWPEIGDGCQMGGRDGLVGNVVPVDAADPQSSAPGAVADPGTRPDHFRGSPPAAVDGPVQQPVAGAAMRLQGRSYRNAFSLVELLVVIAVIAILVSLLLPAVQAARGSARAAQCKSNLRQIGIALHSYHDVHDGFPPAFLAHATVWRPSWTWSTFLLPHLEQGGLFDDLQVTSAEFGGGAVLADTPTPATQTALSIYACPADSGPDWNHRKSGHATSSYHGVLGNESQLVSSYPALIDQNGVFYVNSRVCVEGITDGSSHTLAVGECRLDPGGTGKRGAIWAGMRGFTSNTLWLSDTVWWANAEPDWLINGPGEQAFSSHHPGGAHFVFADGSVRLVAETIAGQTLARLAARNDGEPAGD